MKNDYHNYLLLVAFYLVFMFDRPCLWSWNTMLNKTVELWNRRDIVTRSCYNRTDNNN